MARAKQIVSMASEHAATAHVLYCNDQIIRPVKNGNTLATIAGFHFNSEHLSKVYWDHFSGSADSSVGK